MATSSRVGGTGVSRESILTAAVAQIAAEGYDGVRLRDIAQAAGVSIGLLQHRFQTREALLAEALEHHCDELLERWSALARDEPDPWGRIVSLIARIAYAEDLAPRAAVWAEFNAAASRREELRPALRHIYAAWHAYLRDAIDAGAATALFAPRLDPATIADLLMSMIDGALLTIAGAGGELTGERMHTQIAGAAHELLGRGSRP